MDQVQGPSREPTQKQEETGLDAQLQQGPTIQLESRTKEGMKTITPTT